MVDIILSYNYYLPKYFEKQINNIIGNISESINILIIFNIDYSINVELTQKINEYSFPKNINCIINPIFIKKYRFHGSLTHGIIENMKYIINNNITFKFFIILSNKSLINSISLEYLLTNLNNSKNIYDNFFNKYKHDKLSLFTRNYRERPIRENLLPMDSNKWWWKCNCITKPNNLITIAPEFLNISENNKNCFAHTQRWCGSSCNSFSQTLLFKYIENNNNCFHGLWHEGLYFDYNTIKNILKFFNEYQDIYNDLINAVNVPVEEFSLSTLACHLNGKFASLHISKFNYD